MAEDFDIERVVTDPAYRRQVMARLNEAGGAARSVEKPAATPAAEPAQRQPAPESATAD